VAFLPHELQMRIDSIIIHHEKAVSAYLRRCLLAKFPEINIHGEAVNYSEADKLIKGINPELVFLDVCSLRKQSIPSLCGGNKGNFEMIYISDRSEDAIQAIRDDACGFLLNPLNVTDIVLSVGKAVRKLSERASLQTINQGYANDPSFLPHTKLFGIPTIESIEFLHVHEIIRCEGLQKCTIVLSTRKSRLVSAYNIGEFRKWLEQYGFFSCHKSHLINLMHVRRLTREGFVYLIDNAAVPLARRKRQEFLQMMKHL